jgi:hypothetical protein
VFKGYSVALPFVYNKEDGPYALNKNMLDVVKQNLKTLILTDRGERIMLPEFGVGDAGAWQHAVFNETVQLGGYLQVLLLT